MRRREEKAIDTALNQRDNIFLFNFGIEVRCGEKNEVTLLPGYQLDRGCDAGVERVGDARHDEPDGLCGRTLQYARGVVRTIAELLDGRFNSSQGLRANVVAPVYYA